MNTKTIEARLTSLEELKRQCLSDDKPEWYDDLPDDLKADVERMERMVEEAGGLSSDPFVLKTANRLATFISEWNRSHGHSK